MKSTTCFCARSLLLIFLGLVLSSCAQLNIGFEDPTIRLAAVNYKPEMSLQQKLKIRLNITNPNGYDLPVERLRYEIALDGFSMISGSTSSIGSIPAHGSKDFSVTANVDVAGGMMMVAKMIKNNSKSVNYKIGAVLEVDLPLMPSVDISKQGKVNLGQ